jgi:branched-chain amino acid transport system ATP-binding protein
MSATAPPGLAIERLSVRFDGLAAISEVSLALRKGEVLGLIGPNGAGKTTLVNCLSGFQAPTSGRLFIQGRLATGWSPEKFRQMGVARTFQAGRQFKEMSVLENVVVTALALGLGQRQARDHALALLAWVGLADNCDRRAGSLAYTDQRRLAVARALPSSPSFVLLDEPAAGMSEPEAEDLVALIASMPTTFGCGVVLIEHNMQVVMGVSHRIHVLDGGRTLAEGPPEEIRCNDAVMAAYLGVGGP